MSRHRSPWFVVQVAVYTALGLGGIAAGALWHNYYLGFWMLCASMAWEGLFGQATLRDLIRTAPSNSSAASASDLSTGSSDDEVHS